MIASSTFFRPILLIIALTLAACGKKTPDGPSSPTLERAALMQLAFPGWTPTGPGQKRKLHVSEQYSDAKDAKGKPQSYDADELVDPDFVVRLSDDEAVMTIRAQPVDENGKVQDCDACGADFGAIQFHRNGESWYLSKRTDVFTSAGSMGGGNAGSKIIKLAQNAFALVIEGGSMNMGETVSYIALYDLAPVFRIP